MPIESINFKKDQEELNLPINTTKLSAEDVDANFALTTPTDLSIFTLRYWLFPDAWLQPLSKLNLADIGNIYQPELQQTVGERLDPTTAMQDPIITANLPFIADYANLPFRTEQNANLASAIHTLSTTQQSLHTYEGAIESRLQVTDGWFDSWVFSKERQQLSIYKEQVRQKRAHVEQHLLLATTEAIYRLNTQIGYMPVSEVKSLTQAVATYLMPKTLVSEIVTEENKPGWSRVKETLLSSFEQIKEPLNIFNRTIEYVSLKIRSSSTSAALGQTVAHYAEQTSRLFNYLGQYDGGEDAAHITYFINCIQSLTFDNHQFAHFPTDLYVDSFKNEWKWVAEKPVSEKIKNVFINLSQKLCNFSVTFCKAQQIDVDKIDNILKVMSNMLKVMKCNVAKKDFDENMAKLRDEMLKPPAPILVAQSSNPSPPNTPLISSSIPSDNTNDMTDKPAQKSILESFNFGNFKKNLNEFLTFNNNQKTTTPHATVPSGNFSASTLGDPSKESFTACLEILNSSALDNTSIKNFNTHITQLKSMNNQSEQLQQIFTQVNDKIAVQPELHAIWKDFLLQEVNTTIVPDTQIASTLQQIKSWETALSNEPKKSKQNALRQNMFLSGIVVHLVGNEEHSKQANDLLNTPNHPNEQKTFSQIAGVK